MKTPFLNRLWIAMFGFMILVPVSTGLSQPLTANEFWQLHRELDPGPEKWKTVNWHTDLISGQNAAVQQNKPMFIWAMDGHPLTCT